MTAPHAEQIVEGNMARLERALRDVDGPQQSELVSQVVSHIAEARANLEEETDADVLNILDRLGSPEEVARDTRTQTADSPEEPRPDMQTRSRPDRLRVACGVLAWAGGVTCAIGILLYYGATAELDVRAVLRLLAAVLGVAGGAIVFRRPYVAVVTLVLASVFEGFVVPGDFSYLPLYMGVASGGALALLIAAAAAAGVAAVAPNFRQPNSLGSQ